MKKALIALTILATAISGAQAGIILNDTFDYNADSTPIDLVGAPSSAWVANSGAASMQVATNSLIVTSLRAQDVYRPWQSGPTAYTSNSAAVLYSSYTLNCTFLPSTSGTYFSHFGGTNCFTSSTATITGHRCRVFASLTNGVGGTAGSGQWYPSVINTSGTGTTNSVWPTALETNTTYTIVTRYVVATGDSTLWVDPTSEASASVTNQNPLPWDWTLNTFLNEYYPQNGPINIGFYNFRQATGEGTMIIDNLKVGTRFADVAGTNTAPLLNAPVNQNAPINTAIGPLAFTVEDAETLAVNLNVNVSSSNTGLVPNGSPNVVLASDVGGTNRTITITPATGQQGFTTITLVVDDGVNYTTNSFVVTVGAPTIGAIPNQITKLNTATPTIPFTVSDTGGDTLSFSKSSSNPTLVTPSGIQVGVAVVNVSSNVTVTPEAGQTGVATITLSVGDGFNTNSSSFVVTVSPTPGIIFSEPFNYPDGSLYGATGSPWTHASPTGTNFGQLLVTNGLAQLSRSQAEDVSAPLPGGPYASSSGLVFYTGFQVTFAELPSNLGNYFLHFKDSDTGTTFRAKVFASTSGAAAGLFRLGVSSSANTPSPQFARDLILNQPYLVVTRYNSGTGETRFWVNPTSETSPSADSTDNPLTSQIGAIGLREDSGIGTNYVDNIVISTSFADVVPSIAQPTLAFYVDNLGNFIVSWPSPLFALQSATDVAGPYTDIQGASSPYTNTISGQLFFRASY